MNKKNYLFHKKITRTFLGLGTTIGVLGLFTIISQSFIIGIILLLIGILFLFISYLSKKKNVTIENYCKKSCLICNNDITVETEIKYFVGNSLVDEETFNKVTTEKILREVIYYKCIECKLCMTIIKSYLIINNNQKELNDKISIDFDYTGDY